MENNHDKERTVVVEIDSHAQFIRILSDPKMTWRAIFFLSFMLAAIFLLISIVILSLKEPFNIQNFTMNDYGAVTTSTQDDTETTYWLFNSAELWANSGISVEKGDRLTIRTSGRNHGAIHHLSEASLENRRYGYQWSDGNGREQGPEWNDERMYFPISRTNAEGMILMQVFPPDEIYDPTQSPERQKQLREKYFDGSNPASDERIYAIGKERTEILIHQPGRLHFSINDVVLTDANIERLYKRHIKTMIGEGLNASDTTAAWKILNIPKPATIVSSTGSDTINNACKVDDDAFRLLKTTAHIEGLRKFMTSGGLKIDAYPDPEYVTFINRDHPTDTIHVKAHPLFNELLYYRHHQYYDAWFVDNIGSMLLVIERKKNDNK